MRTDDVRDGSAGTKTRWEAVFACADEFVRNQADAVRKEESAIRRTGAARQLDAANKTSFSLVLWNEAANVCFEREPLGADYGERLRDKMRTSRDQHRPARGTTFAAAFRAANQQLLAKDGRARSGEKTLILFLSDGRPGDLQWEKRVVEGGKTRIQRTYRERGRDFASVAVEIEGMQASFEAAGVKENLGLHFVGIYKEGFQWLRCLAEVYGGQFHETALVLESDAALQSASPPLNASSAAPAAAASAPQNAATATSTGMRSTFLAISAATTAMRAAATGAERAVTLETPWQAGDAAPHLQRRVEGVFELVLRNGSLQPARDARKTQRAVVLRNNPFAQGGLRNVYRLAEEVRGPAPGGAVVSREVRNTPFCPSYEISKGVKYLWRPQNPRIKLLA